MTTTATDPGRRRALIRALSALGAAWGSVLLARPRPVVAVLCPEFPEPRIWVVRVLGGRLVAQHALLLAAPERGPVRGAVVVDLMHAASMVPLLATGRYRRAALISGGIAAAYAGVASVVVPRAEGS